MGIVSTLTNVMRDNAKLATESIQTSARADLSKIRPQNQSAYGSVTAITSQYDSGAYKVSLSREALAKAQG